MPQQAPSQRNCNSQSQVSSIWVGALWRRGGQGQPQEVMLQNLTLPQVWRPEGQLSRSSGQEQAPHWALFPKPHLRGPLELGL